MTPHVLAVLRGARELLADAGKWTQGCHARDAQGRRIPLGDGGEPVQFDLVGALVQVGGLGEASREAAGELHRALQRRGFEAGITAWNDERARTHAEVLELLEELVRGEPA